MENIIPRSPKNYGITFSFDKSNRLMIVGSLITLLAIKATSEALRILIEAAFINS